MNRQLFIDLFRKFDCQWNTALTAYQRCSCHGKCDDCLKFLEDHVCRYGEMLTIKNGFDLQSVDFEMKKSLKPAMDEYNDNVILKRINVLNYVATLIYMAKLSSDNAVRVKMFENYVLLKGENGQVIFVDVMNEEKLYAGERISWFVSERGFRHVPLRLEYIKENFVIIHEQSVYPMNIYVDMLLLFPQQKKEQYTAEVLNNEIKLKIQLVKAVPGAGKTFEIKKDYKRLLNNGSKVRVLTATNNQKEDYIQDGINARTLDGYINVLLSKIYCEMDWFNQQNRKFMEDEKFDAIFVDEVYMVHSASVYYLIYLLKWFYFDLDKLLFVCYGDAGQIPVITRTKKRFKHAKIDENAHLMKYLNLTRRSPQCMIPILKGVYEEIDSLSEERGRIEVLHYFVHDLQMICDNNKDKQILVFTQSEKQMVQRFNSTVMTVHESQGLTFKNVLLLRIHYFEVSLYTEVHYLTVALSRHKNKILYATVKKDDLYDLLLNASPLKENEWQERNIGKIYKPSRVFYNVNKMSVVPKWFVTEDMEEKRSFFSKMMGYGTTLFKYVYNNYVLFNHLDDDQLHLNWTVQRLEIFMVDMFGMYLDQKVEDAINMEKMFDALRAYSNVQVNMEQYFEYFKRTLDRLRTEPICALNVKYALLGRIPQNFGMLLESIMKRNLDESKLRDVFSFVDINGLAKKFENFYLDKDNGRTKIIETNELNNQWLMDRTPDKLGKLFSNYAQERIHEEDWNKYECFLKTQIKLKYQGEEYSWITASQVVTGACITSVFYFNSIVKNLQQTLLDRMKRKFVYNDGYSVDELEDIINNGLIDMKGNVVKVVEMDYSKFDKNQDEIMMMYQIEILKLLGMTEMESELYIKSHLDCKLLFRQAGIKINVHAQRRTGDAFTFFGNTMVTMLIAMYCFKEEDIKFGVFGGDDSILFVDYNAKIKEEADYVARAFNMELKYLNTSRSIMFASRFLIYSGERIHLLPDPMKILARMHREDFETKVHYEAFLISMKVILYKYRNQDIRMKLAESVAYRYAKKIEDIADIIEIILYLIFEDNLIKLYRITDNKKFFRKVGVTELLMIKQRFMKRYKQEQFMKDTLRVLMTTEQLRLTEKILQLYEKQNCLTVREVRKMGMDNMYALHYEDKLILHDRYGVRLSWMNGDVLIDVEYYDNHKKEVDEFIEKEFSSVSP